MSLTIAMPLIDAVRLGVGAVDDRAGLLDRRDDSRTCARQRPHRCRSSWECPPPTAHDPGVAPPGTAPAAPLRAVAADREQHVHPAPDQVADRHPRIDRPPRRVQHRPPLLVNVLDQLRGQHRRLGAAGRIEPAIPAAETEDLPDPVTVVELEKERTDDVVEAGAQPAAGDDPGAGFSRVEEQPFARTRLFEQPWLGRRPPVHPVNLGRNKQIVGHMVIERRRKPALAKRGDDGCHGHGPTL